MQISNCKQWDSALCISRLNFHSVLRLVYYYLVVTVLKKEPSGHMGQVDFPAGKVLGQCLKDTEKLTKAILIKNLCFCMYCSKSLRLH